MAVKKLNGASESGIGNISMASVKKPVVELPTSRTVPPSDVGSFAYFLYGQQKIGKTSFSTYFELALHFMFEPSGKAYELYEVQPTTWAEFVAYIELLEKHKKAGSLTYKTFIIDTVDLLYQLCSVHVCSLVGVEHPNDAKDFGKTWTKIEVTFRDAIIRLASLGGFVAISHEVEKEVETRSGRAYQTVIPSAPKKCIQVLAKFCDMTANYHVNDNGERMLRVQSSPDVEAGNRIDTDKAPRFRWKGTSNKIIDIPMGTSPEEAYSNFVRAFNNELEAKEPSTTVNKPSDKPAIKKKSFSISSVTVAKP